VNSQGQAVGVHWGPKGRKWIVRQHVCAHCGKPFLSAGARATYCHVNCRVAAFAERRREARREGRRIASLIGRGEPWWD
jgi:hypothetical protein